MDLEYTKEQDIVVARRASGGGAVYHDLGNINYTFITQRNASNTLNFEAFSTPMLEALRSLGIPCEISGRNDLVSLGQKFSGSAQRTTQNRILHHGTLLYNSDLSVLSRVLTPSKAKLESKAVKSVRSRVVNLKERLPATMTLDALIAYLASYMEHALSATPSPVSVEAVLASAEYVLHNSWEYNFGQKETYAIEKELYTACGLVQIGYNAKEGIIEKISIRGDFFGTEPVEKLEKELTGTALSPAALQQKLKTIRLFDYFRGITEEEFLSLVLF